MQQGKPTFSSKYADPTHNNNPFASNNMGGGPLGGGFGGFGGRGGRGGGLLGLVGSLTQQPQQPGRYGSQPVNNMQYEQDMRYGNSMQYGRGYYYDQRRFGPYQQQQYPYQQQQQGYMTPEQEQGYLKQMNQQQITQEYFRRGANLTNLFGSVRPVPLYTHTHTSFFH